MRVTEDNPALVIEVRDTGIGIEPEVLPRIFNAFEQGERTVTRLFGGLGLGLTISKALAEMHGGLLHATSEGRDKGATFTVTFPSVSADTEAVAPSPLVPAAVPVPMHSRGLKILLVEDHEDTLRIMCKLLSGLGYTVKSANTVRRALELASREKFDLLISDLGLPDGSGIEVMQAMGRDGVKGIALSGFGMDEDLRRSREAGFQLHLTKPVNFQTLDNVIQRVAS